MRPSFTQEVLGRNPKDEEQEGTHGYFRSEEERFQFFRKLQQKMVERQEKAEQLQRAAYEEDL